MRAVLADYLADGSMRSVGPDTDLLETAMLDSVAVLELVNILEQEVGAQADLDTLARSKTVTPRVLAQLFDGLEP